MNLGDFRLGETLDCKFTTIDADGAPITLAGTPVISAYPGNSTTQLTAGITLSVDFDGVTGLHNVRVVASSGNGYATATNYVLVITTGTVDGTSVVGYVVAHFSIENRSALMPTTAARTLDVSAGGEAGVDWANVGSPSTTVNLSGTTTNVVNTASAVTTVNGLAANVITAAATAADFGTEIGTAVWATAARSLTVLDEDSTTLDLDATIRAAVGLTAANLDTQLGDIPTNAELTAAVANVSVDEIQATALADLFNTDSGTTYASAVAGSVVAEIADNAGGSALTAGAIADAVWDEAQADHVTAGSFGEVATEVASILVDTAEIGAAGAGLTNINLPDQTMNITGNITGNLSGSVGSVTGSVGSVTGNVGGNVAGSVGSVTAAVTVDDSTPVEVNVKKINDVTITGDGSGTPFNV